MPFPPGESRASGYSFPTPLIWVRRTRIAFSNMPKRSSGSAYSKIVAWIRKDNYVVVRSKVWVKKGKRNKYLDVKKLEQIDGIWVATELTMTTKKGKASEEETELRRHIDIDVCDRKDANHDLAVWERAGCDRDGRGRRCLPARNTPRPR